MSTHQEIKKKIKEWDESLPKGIYSFVEDTLSDSDGEVFEKLKDFVEYVDLYGLRDLRIKDYIDAKFHLKRLALKNYNNKKISDDDKELAFYDWLKICVNPQQDANYDFYFEKNGLDKEDEVENILFEKDGNLREIFKKPDWQIRLKKITDWFLKRYDIDTARKILKNVNSPYKNWLDTIKLLIPRLWGAIFIGFLLLIVGEETWKLPLQLHWSWVISLSAGFLIITFGYLIVEANNIIHNTKKAFQRARFIFVLGFLISLIFSCIIVFVMGTHFVNDKNLRVEGWDFLGRLMFSENIIFFATAALLIGIFIQIFWEEKTITEPL
jgi:uncharacterized membrane protein